MVYANSVKPAVSLAVFQLKPLKCGKIGGVKSVFDPKEVFCKWPGTSKLNMK